MGKYGMAHEKHDHTPKLPEKEEWACGYYPKQRCGKDHICCYHCDILYRCQEGRCVQAVFSMMNQPNPQSFTCPRTKSISEITWELIFAHGTDCY